MRVAVALYKLAHGASYKSLQHTFGVAPATCQSICAEVYHVLWKHYRREYISIYQGDRMRLNTRKFEGKNNMPGCIGAIDGTHIPIVKPKRAQSEYRNMKNFHSIILSTLVDWDAAFMSVDIGFPGKAHDARVYRTSKHFRKAQNHFGIILACSIWLQM